MDHGRHGAPRPRSQSRQDVRASMPAARAPGRGGFERLLRGWRSCATSLAGEARDRRASGVSSCAGLQVPARRWRRLDAVALRRSPARRHRWSASGSGGAAGDQGRDRRPAYRRSTASPRLAGAPRQRQAAALDRGEVLAHAVHLADVGAAAQQRLVDRLLVGQRQALGRCTPAAPRRRPKSGRAPDRSRSSPAPSPACAGPRSRRSASGTGCDRPRRPRCAGNRHAVAVAREHQPGDRSRLASTPPARPAPSRRRPCPRRSPRCGPWAAMAGAAAGSGRR